MIKNLIFDVGDVLLSYDWKTMLMDHGLSEKDTVRVAHRMFNSPYWSLMDLATIPEEQIIDCFKETFPDEGDDIEWFIKHGELMHRPRQKVWDRIRELKKEGYKIYILSNYSENLFKQHIAGASFMDELDGGIVSYQVHCIKPDYRIYQLLLKKYSLKAEECIFFDDRAENIKAAKELGFEGEVIESEEHLLGLLSKLHYGQD